VTAFNIDNRCQKYPVQILFYSVSGEVAMIDFVALESVALETFNVPAGFPCAVAIETGTHRDALDDLLNQWAEAGEVLEISFETGAEGGGLMMLESCSVLLVLKTDAGD
jgi:hypothetical protein